MNRRIKSNSTTDIVRSEMDVHPLFLNCLFNFVQSFHFTPGLGLDVSQKGKSMKMQGAEEMGKVDVVQKT